MLLSLITILRGDNMAQRGLKECKYRSCYKLTRNRSGYCDDHLNNYKDIKRSQRYEHDKKYNAKRDAEVQKFYNSNAWRSKRIYILIRDNYHCYECLNNKKITQATEVHHIVKVKDDLSLGLDNDNLISVCASCHKKLDKLNNK